MHKYLHSGSSLLCTHWDSHSRHWKKNDGMFLRSDRLDYSLQIQNNFFRGPPSLKFKVVSFSYLCSRSSLLRTHWDSHSKHWKMNDGMFLRSDRLDYSLQIQNNHFFPGPPAVCLCIAVPLFLQCGPVYFLGQTQYV